MSCFRKIVNVLAIIVVESFFFLAYIKVNMTNAFYNQELCWCDLFIFQDSISYMMISMESIVLIYISCMAEYMNTNNWVIRQQSKKNVWNGIVRKNLKIISAITVLAIGVTGLVGGAIKYGILEDIILSDIINFADRKSIYCFMTDKYSDYTNYMAVMCVTVAYKFLFLTNISMVYSLLTWGYGMKNLGLLVVVLIVGVNVFPNNESIPLIELHYLNIMGVEAQKTIELLLVILVITYIWGRIIFSKKEFL